MIFSQIELILQMIALKKSAESAESARDKNIMV